MRAMDEIYSLLVTIDYPDGVTGGLRRTTDALRAVLERTRGDLTTTIVAARLQAAIESAQRATGGLSPLVADSSFGGVAQLVERYVRNVEVGGSSPLTSTPVVILTTPVLGSSDDDVCRRVLTRRARRGRSRARRGVLPGEWTRRCGAPSRELARSHRCFDCRQVPPRDCLLTPTRRPFAIATGDMVPTRAGVGPRMGRCVSRSMFGRVRRRRLSAESTTVRLSFGWSSRRTGGRRRARRCVLLPTPLQFRAVQWRWYAGRTHVGN